MKNLKEGKVALLGLDLSFNWLVPEDFGSDYQVMAVPWYVACPPQVSVDGRWQTAMLGKQELLV